MFKKHAEDALKKERAHRSNNVIVPDAMKFLAIEDKDGNAVVRFVALKAQSEDFVKAARRKNINARVFLHDMESHRKMA